MKIDRRLRGPLYAPFPYAVTHSGDTRECQSRTDRYYQEAILRDDCNIEIAFNISGVIGYLQPVCSAVCTVILIFHC